MEFIDENELETADPKVVHSDDIPLVDLAKIDDVRPTVGIRPIDEVLGLERIAAKLWYFDSGEEVGFHAHPNEEELYYVVDGEFSLKMGDADDPTFVTVGPDTFFAAGPYEPHGHRCISEEGGVVLALGAPADAGDEVIDPHEM